MCAGGNGEKKPQTNVSLNLTESCAAITVHNIFESRICHNSLGSYVDQFSVHQFYMYFLFKSWSWSSNCNVAICRHPEPPHLCGLSGSQRGRRLRLYSARIDYNCKISNWHTSGRLKKAAGGLTFRTFNRCTLAAKQTNKPCLL